MKMRIAFDPTKLKPTDEAYPAFEAGGMTLTYWALYKKHFITSDRFAKALRKMGDRCSLSLPWTDIASFIEFAVDLGLYHSRNSREFEQWAIRYWDYFNPNIQRKLTLVYDALAIVETEWKDPHSQHNMGALP